MEETKLVGRKLTVESAVNFLVRNCDARKEREDIMFGGEKIGEKIFLKIRRLSNAGAGCYDFLRKKEKSIDLITILEG